MVAENARAKQRTGGSATEGEVDETASLPAAAGADPDLLQQVTPLPQRGSQRRRMNGNTPPPVNLAGATSNRNGDDSSSNGYASVDDEGDPPAPSLKLTDDQPSPLGA